MLSSQTIPTREIVGISVAIRESTKGGVNMRELATNIVLFMMGFDWYEANDQWETVNGAVEDMTRQLYSKPHRKAIAGAMKDIAEWCEYDDDASVAATLYRQIVAL